MDNYNNLHKVWDNAHKYGSPTFFVRKFLIESKLKKLLKSDDKKKVLDVGCGTGVYTDFILNLGKYYVGIDISNYAIGLLKKKYPQVTFKCVDVNNFKSQEKFDLILISEVLEHIENQKNFLDKIHFLLKPKGVILVSVPYDPSLWSYSDEQANHKRRYTKEELKNILAQSKFKKIKTICYGFPLLRIYWNITKLFRKQIQNRQKKPNKILDSEFIKKLLMIDTIYLTSNKGVGLISISSKE